VSFDVGESYAGLLPISSHKNETRELYFWYFPSENEAAENEITIWLNGGPGCSSLEGLLQENGPFLWQYGTFKPVKNPYTWVNLTNMVWVEQPVGTGFSQGTPSATSETDVASQFLGFFKNFLDTFNLHHKKIFITGESYAGYYIPYIADAMLNTKDTKYYDVEAILMYDPSTSTNQVQEESKRLVSSPTLYLFLLPPQKVQLNRSNPITAVPVVAMVDANLNLFSFNASFLATLHSKADSCGYTSFLNDYLVYPPKGPLPDPPATVPGCDLWTAVFNAALEINPCFDIYQIATTCPILWDVLGFPGSIPYLPEGAEIYFNRTDVQKAINAPPTNWAECAVGNVFAGNGSDSSPPSGLSVLPHVIERLNRTIIGHGLLDMILIANGTRLMIQNMTWNGAQGFQKAPSDEFFVPYHSELSLSTLAGAGVFGTTHTERGLTYVEVSLSGHSESLFLPRTLVLQYSKTSPN